MDAFARWWTERCQLRQYTSREITVMEEAWAAAIEEAAKVAEAADPCTCKKIAKCHANMAGEIRRRLASSMGGGT